MKLKTGYRAYAHRLATEAVARDDPSIREMGESRHAINVEGVRIGLSGTTFPFPFTKESSR